MPLFQKKIAEIGRALRFADIPYIIIGGQAVLVYGEPRFTKDIDITLGVDIDVVQTVLKAAEEAGFRPAVDDPPAFVKKYSVLPVVDPVSSIRADLIFSFMPYEREAMSRAVQIPVEGEQVRFASAEDVIIHKMIASRPKDLEDVKSIVRSTSDLKMELIRHWLGEFARADGTDYWKLFQEISSSKESNHGNRK